jgi:hypothetical protein
MLQTRNIRNTAGQSAPRSTTTLEEKENVSMDNDDRTYEDHMPIALCAAPAGYRVTYVEPDDGDPGWLSQPVHAFGVCEITLRPVQGSSARPRLKGREIHALVDHGGYLACAEEAGNFWQHLPPEAGDPTPDAVAREQERQRWVRERR